jgi:uncharacterized membrane protein
MADPLIQSDGGVLAVLCAVAACWFLVEKQTQFRPFQYIPPLIFIYVTPIFLNKLDVIPSASPVYAGLSAYALPACISRSAFDRRKPSS